MLYRSFSGCTILRIFLFLVVVRGLSCVLRLFEIQEVMKGVDGMGSV